MTATEYPSPGPLFPEALSPAQLRANHEAEPMSDVWACPGTVPTFRKSPRGTQFLFWSFFPTCALMNLEAKV